MPSFHRISHPPPAPPRSLPRSASRRPTLRCLFGHRRRRANLRLRRQKSTTVGDVDPLLIIVRMAMEAAGWGNMRDARFYKFVRTRSTAESQSPDLTQFLKSSSSSSSILPSVRLATLSPAAAESESGGQTDDERAARWRVREICQTFSLLPSSSSPPPLRRQSSMYHSVIPVCGLENALVQDAPPLCPGQARPRWLLSLRRVYVVPSPGPRLNLCLRSQADPAIHAQGGEEVLALRSRCLAAAWSVATLAQHGASASFAGSVEGEGPTGDRPRQGCHLPDCRVPVAAETQSFDLPSIPEPRGRFQCCVWACTTCEWEPSRGRIRTTSCRSPF